MATGNRAVAPTELNKKGLMALGFPAAWVKSPSCRSMSGHALQPRPDDGHPVRPDALPDAALEDRSDPAR
jgi:hypothetical protein